MVSPVAVFDHKGKVNFIIGTIRDITAHVQLREEHRAKEKLHGLRLQPFPPNN